MTFMEIVKMTQKDLKAALVDELTQRDYVPQVADGYIYAPGDIPVLMVAHMDTVHKERCTDVCVSETGVFMSPQGIGGDDRCGIFMVLETIKTHRCHVLFTEDEEIGLIGAGKFASSGIKPDVNWILEYDRKGKDDAVFYSCDNPDFTEFITDPEIGFVLANGSASDISKVAPAINTAAVNISCGYYNQHKLNEYVIVSEMMNNIERGKRLIDKPCDHFEYIEKVYTPTTYYSGYSNGSSYYYGSSAYNDLYWDYYKSSDTKSNHSILNYDDDWDDDAEEAEKNEIRDSLYADFDSIAIELFYSHYGNEPRHEELLYVDELCDYEDAEFVIYSGENTISFDDYSSHSREVIMIDKSCRIYRVACDNSYGVDVAIRTDEYLMRKDGERITYYPDRLMEYPIMSEIEYSLFDEYMDSYLEFEFEELVDEKLVDSINAK